MELAFIIYTLIFLFTLTFAFVGINAAQWRDDAGKSWKTWGYWSIAIVFYTLILGLREDVGLDYTSYKNVFINMVHSGGELEGIDFIYYIFLPIVQGVHYNIFIAFLAFLVILFIFLVFADRSKILLFYLLIFFTLLPFFISLNIMRQYAAMFIIFYAFNQILKSNYIGFFLSYLLAFVIHKSCLILFPFVFFLRVDFFKYTSIQYILLIVSFLYGSFIFEMISELLRVLSLPDFLSLYQQQYVESFDFRTDRASEITEESKSTGFFPIFLTSITLVVILFSRKLKIKYEKYNFIFYYNLYFIGVIFSNILSYNEGLDRLVQYFTFYRSYIFSIFLYYIFLDSEKKYFLVKVFLIFVIFISLVFFYMVIYRGTMKISPFQFI